MHCKSDSLRSNHTHIWANFSLQTAVIEVNRTSPVVIFVNIGAPLRVLRIVAPTVTRVIIMSSFPLRNSLAVLDVAAAKVAFLDQFPFAALPFSYDANSSATAAILDAAEQVCAFSSVRQSFLTRELFYSLLICLLLLTMAL